MEGEAAEFLAILELAAHSPNEALAQLWQAVTTAEGSGNVQKAHAIKDVVLVLLIHHKKDLDQAEQLAIELVSFLPDRFHLELLGKVFGLLGKKSEEASAVIQARAAKDMHDSDKFRQIREDVYRQLHRGD
jgi:hypothetical protein